MFGSLLLLLHNEFAKSDSILGPDLGIPKNMTEISLGGYWLMLDFPSQRTLLQAYNFYVY